MKPAAISDTSWGQIDPEWYPIGLYPGWPAAYVRMPQPLNMSGAISRSTTRRARSGDAIPDHRQWPALEAIASACRFSPSSAMT